MLCLGFEFASAIWRKGFTQDELERESRSLINLLSQRVDQHDAHLTSLSALAQLGETPDQTLFLEVSAAIQRFYPRVTAIDLVTLSGQGAATPGPNTVLPLVTTRPDGPFLTRIAHNIHTAASESRGELVLLPSPANTARYLLVKRSPNSEQARHALALEIDVPALLLGLSDYWHRPNASLAIALPEGTALMTSTQWLATKKDSSPDSENQSLTPVVPPAETTSSRTEDARQTLFGELGTSGTLTSRTQPLNLSTRYTLELVDLLPLRFSIGGPLMLALLFALGAGIHRLILRTRRAELNAKLSVNEARIAHASRVNSLGEMASGMAHELNQPLTAVLGQSQAGLRLLKSPAVDLQRIAGVLEANVSQAKRASAILATLRDWSSGTTRNKMRVSVNESVANVVSLIDAEAKRLSINIDAQLDPSNPQIEADPVELEQVVYNLVRNALDAVADPNRHDQLESQETHERENNEYRGLIRIVTEHVKDEVNIVISDNGRGISADIQKRLFEPFVTGKPGGMGLGLALCARIVERYDGRIEINSNAVHGATAIVQIPCVWRITN